MNRAAVSRSLSGELRLVEQETSLRILLAEDDHELRRLLTLILHRDGHEIVEAKDGGELLEALAATLLEPKRPDFDLIICEHALPGIPGLTVLAGLRSRDRDLPFILITGNVVVAANARRLGAVILRQPLSVEAIRSADPAIGGARAQALTGDRERARVPDSEGSPRHRHFAWVDTGGAARTDAGAVGHPASTRSPSRWRKRRAASFRISARACSLVATSSSEIMSCRISSRRFAERRAPPVDTRPLRVQRRILGAPLRVQPIGWHTHDGDERGGDHE